LNIPAFQDLNQPRARGRPSMRSEPHLQRRSPADILKQKPLSSRNFGKQTRFSRRAQIFESCVGSSYHPPFRSSTDPQAGEGANPMATRKSPAPARKRARKHAGPHSLPPRPRSRPSPPCNLTPSINKPGLRRTGIHAGPDPVQNSARFRFERIQRIGSVNEVASVQPTSLPSRPGYEGNSRFEG